MLLTVRDGNQPTCNLAQKVNSSSALLDDQGLGSVFAKPLIPAPINSAAVTDPWRRDRALAPQTYGSVPQFTCGGPNGQPETARRRVQRNRRAVS